MNKNIFPFVTSLDPRTINYLEKTKPKMIATNMAQDKSLPFLATRVGVKTVVLIPDTIQRPTPPATESGAKISAEQYAERIVAILKRSNGVITHVVTPESLWRYGFLPSLDVWYSVFFEQLKNYTERYTPVALTFSTVLYSEDLVSKLPKTFDLYDSFMLRVIGETSLKHEKIKLPTGKSFFNLIQLTGYEGMGWRSRYSGVSRDDYLAEVEKYTKSISRLKAIKGTFLYSLGADNSLINSFDVLEQLR